MLLLTAEGMRELDRATIEGGHAAGHVLMERAGEAVAATIERRYGPVLAMRVLVLCGPGNNGGDGFVAARRLRQRGAVVRVGLIGPRARVRGDAEKHLDRLEREGQSVDVLTSDKELARLVTAFDAWDYGLDALLGTGAHGEPEGLIANAVQALRELDERGTRVIAVDLPTGVNADTGEIARRAVRADLTVTFGAPKRGHVLYPGRAFTGVLDVADIGLLPPAADSALARVELSDAAVLAPLVPLRDPRAHKGSVGRVLVVGGSAGLTGAVALAARAATRAGAGVVRCAVPRSLADVLAAKLTEEMTVPCAESGARGFSLEAAGVVVAAVETADAVLVGSGLSREPQAAELARRLVTSRARPLVLDADGLNAFEGRAKFAQKGAAPLVLTPHVGEMARLTGLDAAAIEAGRIELAGQWAKKWNAVLVLKGAPTVTAAPDGRTTVNATGNPGLATAGTGDVLAGTIAALLAQRLEPYDAARLAAHAHGAAGDEAAATLGVPGMGASDVVEELPRAFRSLERVRDRALERHLPR